jgi:hypothetical protein
MGFGGLVFTDALNMKGVTKSYKPGEIEVMALQAGNDVLLFPEDVPEAVARIKKALKGRQLDGDDLERKVRKSWPPSSGPGCTPAAPCRWPACPTTSTTPRPRRSTTNSTNRPSRWCATRRNCCLSSTSIRSRLPP